MTHFKKYSYFYVPYTLFVAYLSVLIISYNKAELHLLMTSFYTPATDIFFKYYTEVGASIPFWVAGGLLFYKYRVALFVLISQLITGLAVQIIKYFYNIPRPAKYFEENFPNISLHRVFGVDLNYAHSFPSGHTTSAFALFLALAFFVKKPSWHFLAFVLAALAGYSRVYLSQHFAIDLLVGSLIAVSLTTLLFLSIQNKPLKWADGSLRDVFSIKRR